MKSETLNRREKMAVIILLFMLKLINPTSYTHQIDELKKQLLDEELQA